VRESHRGTTNAPTAPTVADNKTTKTEVTVCVRAPRRDEFRKAFRFSRKRGAETRYVIRCVMREAAMAAPKPLSMFTTVIPAAQLFNIVRSGAIPWNEAP